MKVELQNATYPNHQGIHQIGRDFGTDIDKIADGYGTFAECLIEYAGRVCYHSTDKMGKSPNFLRARVREGHEDIIEHVVATVIIVTEYEGKNPERWRDFNRFANVFHEGHRHNADNTWSDIWSVSANIRVWLDLFRQGIAREVLPTIYHISPEIFHEFEGLVDSAKPIWYSNRSQPKYMIPVKKGDTRTSLLAWTDELKTDCPIKVPSYRKTHNAATFLFEGISRTCSHQLVRHRLGSFSQESQRYVDAKKGKWGVVVPEGIGNNEEARMMFDQAWEIVRQTYTDLRDSGLRKEDARFILPGACETRIVTSMTLEGWSHFFWLRACDKAAQWEIRTIAQSALELLYQVWPEVFQDHWDVYQEKFVKGS